MTSLVKVFKALSDETRLRILNLLLQRECCVCEVMQALDISQTRASRNLNILHNAGLLKLRRNGLWAFYSVKPPGISHRSVDILSAVKLGLKGDRLIKRDLERLKDTKRSGPGCGPVAETGDRR